MPVNIKLTKDLTRPIVPDCTPENAVREYYFSVSAAKQEKKNPEWDIARYSPATELISKQRQLEDITARLRDKRQEQSSTRQELDKQWEDLAEEENQLRKSFIKFNQFVKDNLDKRERAERKINEGKNVYNKKRQEVESLKEQLLSLTEAKEKMEKYVTQYKIYEEFLENVAATTSEFQSIYDISTRYDILMDTRAELAAKQLTDHEEMEKLRNEMTNLDEEKELMLMGINNEMAELQTEYDEAKQKSLYWETMVGKIKTISVVKKTEIAEVKTSCWSLYVNMKKSRTTMVEKSRDDIEGQLVEIKRAMCVLERVSQEVKRRSGFDTRTSIQDNIHRSRRREERKMITADDLLALEVAEEKKRMRGKEKKEAKRSIEGRKLKKAGGTVHKSSKRP